MTESRAHRPRTLHLLLSLLGILALAAALLPQTARAQTAQAPSTERIGEDADPVLAAIAINQAKGTDPAARIVLGRSDVFADNLAATALAGQDGALLLTEGGPEATVRQEVLAELDRTLPQGTCTDGEGPTVHLAGGVNAVSQAVEDAVQGQRYCVERVEGPSRVETAVAIADRIADPSGTVLLARADEWADAGSVGAWAALTNSRLLVTQTGSLHPAAEEALRRYAPDEIVLLGGVNALAAEVEQAASQIASTRRVQGPTRDGTAVAIAEQLWGGARSGDVALAEGFAAGAWTYLFASAPFAADRTMPILYTDGDGLSPATTTYLDTNPPAAITAIGPGVPFPQTGTTEPPTDLGAAAVAVAEVGTFTAPLMAKARPGTEELWIAERAGRVQVVGPEGRREVLDISDTISTAGEGGLLGLAFDPEGTRFWTSSTNSAGDSVIDEFDVVGDGVALDSRRELLRVDQPASNHNGGDLHWGPDGYLWWSMGDGGGGGDTYEQGQRPDTLLASMVRIDVDGGDPYVIPPDNPFADGSGGAPELWAFGLRNPFRFAFDDLTGDLYIADVGQSAVEEINWLPAGQGAGSNFGWPIFEGTRPFRGGELPGHVPPVWEEFHDDGSCSITGGVVYRGDAIPELRGAYLYSDLCRSSIRAILVEDGRVVQDADLGVAVQSPVGFGVDHDGEVLIMSLSGQVNRLVPE